MLNERVSRESTRPLETAFGKADKILPGSTVSLTNLTVGEWMTTGKQE